MTRTPHLPAASVHGLRRALGVVALCVLAGCSTNAEFDAAGSAPAAASHLYVTVNEVWLAAAADTLPEANSGWIKNPLTTPITVDLANLESTLTTLVSSVSVPAGTYAQVHLVLADSGDALVTSAQSIGLSYNSQISITATNGASTTAPLESPVPGFGITIPTSLVIAGSLTLDTSNSTSSSNATSTPTASTPASGSVGSTTASSTTNVAAAVSLDGSRDVLTYTYGTTVGYLLSPVMNVLNENAAGGISGTVDTSGLASSTAAPIVSAEVPDPTNTHHVVVLRTVAASGGAFTLYPLPVPTSGTTDYDLVISYPGADTVIVRGIPVGNAAIGSAVVAQTTPFTMTAAPTVYADLSTQSPTLPGGARVTFYQTVPASGEIPYSIDSSAVDMVTRHLPNDAFALSAGPLQVGAYQGGGPVSFASTAPLEGSGGYVVGSEGLYRVDALVTTPAVITGSSTAATPVMAAVPGMRAGAVAGRLAVSIAAAAGEYDSGFVVVSAGGRVVETANVGALLLSGGGTVTLAGIPSGSSLAPATGVPYQVAVRAWNSGNVAASFVRVASTTSVTLGNSGYASVSLQMP